MSTAGASSAIRYGKPAVRSQLVFPVGTSVSCTDSRALPPALASVVWLTMRRASNPMHTTQPTCPPPQLLVSTEVSDIRYMPDEVESGRVLADAVLDGIR